MNTKQIWNALMKNENTKDNFDGVFSSDMLENIVIKPKLIICNTDPSYKKGKHWVLFYFENEIVEFYDSSGNSISMYKNFAKFGKKYALKYKESTYRTQPSNTSICGEMCLYYAYYRCRGYNMEYILNKMYDIKKVLSFVNCKFNICKNSNSELLQCCTQI